MRILPYILFVSLLSAVAGCSSRSGHGEVEDAHHAGDAHDDNVRSVTVWQDSVELFAEWGDLIQGETTEALVHLTDMRDYSPVSSGTLVVSWEQGGRTITSELPVDPIRPGIFRTTLKPALSGKFDLRFRLRSSRLEAQVVVSDVEVFASSHSVTHDEGEESGHDLIGFLKEQQWQISFATEIVERRTLHKTIRALGEIKAAGSAEADVIAPVAGLLMPDDGQGIARPGQRVSQGDILARLAPASGSDDSWNRLVNDYRLAKAEFDRVQRLRDQGAVSEKRLYESKAALENAHARVRGSLGESVDVDALELDGGAGFLRAPRSGVLSNVSFRFGQFVEAGELLAHIVDVSRVWLEAQVPVSESFDLNGIQDAYFTLTGSDSLIRTKDLDGRRISVGALLDPQTRRIPVIFELNNADQRLRPGSFAQVFLKTAAARDALSVPESAILDEEGLAVCYVQEEGEGFEKRILKVGVKDEGYVEILSGLGEGERVVTRGAYKIRLAALQTSSTQSGHGHGH